MMRVVSWLLGVVWLLSACATVEAPGIPADRTLAYADAVAALSQSLAAQLQGAAPAGAEPAGMADRLTRLQRGLGQAMGSPRQLVIAPILDAQTGYGTLTTVKLQEDLAAALSAQVKGLGVQPLAPASLEAAQLLLFGAISYEAFGSVAGRRENRLVLSVVDRRDGSVLASAAAWILARDVNSTPSALFQESPVFLNDQHTRELFRTAHLAVGQKVDPVYLQRISTSAMAAEANQAYARQDYNGALALFAQVEARPDGRSMRTYSGLYVTQLKLGRLTEAEASFGKLVAAAFAEQNLSLRFLFRVNSTDFFPDPKLTEQYPMWLRQLAAQIVRTGTCVDIVGHSSPTGGEAYNNQLSLRRAEAIRRALQSEASGAGPRTRASGRGSRENIIGTGSDDARDAIDRRVEFKLFNCV